MPRYRPVDPKADFPRMEEDVLAYWAEHGVVAKSFAWREGAPEWVFYDGPPTANNRPHIGHVEARTFKDLYPRYRAMTGSYVHRKAGWDCHGLPVEVEVEKRIGTKSKRDIEAFGIQRFVDLCRESVKEYVADWRQMSERMGFWIDMDDAYWTMDAAYVQSVWWALKELHSKGLLFQDHKVTAYCPRCGTALSDAEVAMGYKQVEDPSVHLRFPVTAPTDDALRGAAFVGWTTTPWTLVSNMGLAVDASAEYVRVTSPKGDLVVAAARLEELREALGVGDDDRSVTVLDHFAGRDLVGSLYEPPFANVDDGSAHRVVAADFVSLSEGTGIVHMAPAFGADDLEIGRREGWPVFNPVDDQGRFTDLAGPGFVRGRFVKDADPDIVADLEARGLIVSASTAVHTYPLCWRCETPLLYYARPAWYVRTTARKEELLEANERTNWYPEHIQQGRYGDWLRNNVDWSLSRERYWGTPLPIWRCEAGHDTVVGSLAELSAVAGRDVTAVDPHRPAIDGVVFPCPTCAAQARRVPEVIDAWFDSGAMPFAQWSYMGPDSPAAEVFSRRFPADFIAEGLDQTRGWFYSLMAEGVLLFGQNAYRNVICHGLVVDADGRKMSKRLGNVVEPMSAFDRVGADAVRWYMVAAGSPWSNRRLTFEILDDVVRRFFLPLWNVYAFYVTYANLDEPVLADAPAPRDRSALDRWLLSRLHSTVAAVRPAMEAYDATGAARRIEELVDDLSNWYVRRSRRRFWDPARSDGAAGGTASVSGGSDAAGKASAYATLFEALTTLARLLAPFVPFLAEEIHRNLALAEDGSAPASVHLTAYPEADPSLMDPALEDAMAVVRSLTSLGRTVRSEAKVRVRQPLHHAVVHVPAQASGSGPLADLLPLLGDELNVKDVVFAGSAEEMAGWHAKPNFRALGPRLGSRVQELAQSLARDDGTVAAALAAGSTVEVALPSGSIAIGADDVELTQQPRPGWALATDGPLAVALELTLTDELVLEGMAREVIHHVQALRKSAGLEVTDRIDLTVAAAAGSVAARSLEAFGDRIAREVLAERLSVSDQPTSEGEIEGLQTGSAAGSAFTVSVDGDLVTFSLRRA